MYNVLSEAETVYTVCNLHCLVPSRINLTLFIILVIDVKQMYLNFVSKCICDDNFSF